MRITSTALWLPKQGNSDDEYEDAVFPEHHIDHADLSEFKCAVADGATETSFAGLWARLLVEGYVDSLDLEKLRSEWTNSIKGKHLAWYAEEKVESGAFAALVGLTLKDDQSWGAQAVGDSCVLHVRDDAVLVSFPLINSEQFNSSPVLLSSCRSADPQTELLLTIDGTWQPGDSFYLMSDAIARWTLKREEEHSDSVKSLCGLTAKDRLQEFAQCERTKYDTEGRPLLRNDDVTLLRVDLM